MILTLAMARKGPPCGWDTKCISRKPCEEDLPQLITHVQTTHAALPDGKALSIVHVHLADKNLLPAQHLVDSGYIDAANLHESQVSYEVDLVGPTLNHDWYQAGTDYDLTHCSIDWDAQAVTCPQGHLSSSWTPAQDPKGRPVIKIKFSQTDCRACPSQTACTGQNRRTLTVQPRERMQALLAARKREDTDAWKRHLSPSCRHSWDPFTGCTHPGLTTLPLCGLAQNPFRPCGHRYCGEPGPTCPLAQRGCAGTNSHF